MATRTRSQQRSIPFLSLQFPTPEPSPENPRLLKKTVADSFTFRAPMAAPPLGFRLLKRSLIQSSTQEDPIIPNSSDPIFKPPNTKPLLPPIGHERWNKKNGELSNGRNYRLFEAAGIEEKPLMALLQVLSRINPSSGFRESKQSGEVRVRVRNDEEEVEGEEIVWKGLSYMK